MLDKIESKSSRAGARDSAPEPYEVLNDPDHPGPAGAMPLRLSGCDAECHRATARNATRTDPALYPLRRAVRLNGVRFTGTLEIVGGRDADGIEFEGVRVRVTDARADYGELRIGPAELDEARRELLKAA